MREVEGRVWLVVAMCAAGTLLLTWNLRDSALVPFTVEGRVPTDLPWKMVAFAQASVLAAVLTRPMRSGGLILAVVYSVLGVVLLGLNALSTAMFGFWYESDQRDAARFLGAYALQVVMLGVAVVGRRRGAPRTSGNSTLAVAGAWAWLLGWACLYWVMWDRAIR